MIRPAPHESPHPRGHPAARRQGARRGRPGTRRPVRPRRNCTIRTRGRGPRSRTCTPQGRHQGHAAARWQGARDRPPSSTSRRAVRPGNRDLDRHRGHRQSGRQVRFGHALGRWHGVPGGRLLRRAVRPGHRVLDHHRVHAPPHDAPPTLLLDGTVLAAGGHDCWTGVCDNGLGGAVRPCRRVAANRAGVPEPDPDLSSQTRPQSRPRSRPRPVPSRRAHGPGRSRSTTGAPNPRRCSWPRKTSKASWGGSSGPRPRMSCHPAPP